MKRLSMIGLAALLLVPLTGIGNYPLHLLILCLLWAYVYTSWAVMGRLGRGRMTGKCKRHASHCSFSIQWFA